MEHGKSAPATTEYFTGLASVYAEHRPTYPAEATGWIIESLPAPIRAADIGCGTGISTRLLAERGVRVLGIDPNADMLAEATRHASNSIDNPVYHVATAQQTGLPDESLDLVLCAQSFHWFDVPAAMREFHRILRPGGRVALMWNVKEPADAFSAGYLGNTERAQADAARRGLTVPEERAADATIGGYFLNMRQRSFPNPQMLNLEGLLGRARSASYFPKSGAMRDALEADLIELFHEHQREGIVTLWHRTEVTLADRS